MIHKLVSDSRLYQVVVFQRLYNVRVESDIASAGLQHKRFQRPWGIEMPRVHAERFIMARHWAEYKRTAHMVNNSAILLFLLANFIICIAFGTIDYMLKLFTLS